MARLLIKGRAPPPCPCDLLTDRQPELTRGHVFAARSRTPSDCGDRSYRMKPLSRQTPTPRCTPGLLRRFTRFQPPSISFNDLQVYHCYSSVCVCVCRVVVHREPQTHYRKRSVASDGEPRSCQAGPRAVIDDEARPRVFYGGCSAAACCVRGVCTHRRPPIFIIITHQ